MKKTAKEQGQERKVMTYRNNNKRVIKLANLGLIKEIKQSANDPMHTVNIHGRKDYRVTMKGQNTLVNTATSVIKSTDEYLKSIRSIDPLPIDIEHIKDLQRSMTGLEYTLRIIQRANIERSKRQLLAQQQVVGSTITTGHTKVHGHDIELTHITPSKDLVDFETRHIQQKSSTGGISQSPTTKKSKSITTAPLQKKKR